MWQYNYSGCDELYHHGIKGMRWGVRRYQNSDGSLTKAGKERYSVDSNKTIKVNSDGSKTIPAGFMFNRVGKSTMDVNKSGGLYVSYGKDDAARYVKNLGPTPLRKLMGLKADTVQHIKVKSSLKMPSDEKMAIESAKLLLSDDKLFNSFKDSFYAVSVTGDFGRTITKDDVKKALESPSGKDGQKLAYGVASFFGDSSYKDQTQQIYDHFRKQGYDAVPDLLDRRSGTSKTAMIVINPSKVEVESTTTITKDVMQAAKQHVKTLEKLQVSELIKD